MDSKYSLEYLQKGLINLLHFLRRNIYLRNDKLETNNFNWVWLGKARSSEANLDDLRGGLTLKIV